MSNAEPVPAESAPTDDREKIAAEVVDHVTEGLKLLMQSIRSQDITLAITMRKGPAKLGKYAPKNDAAKAFYEIGGKLVDMFYANAMGEDVKLKSVERHEIVAAAYDRVVEELGFVAK